MEPIEPLLTRLMNVLAEQFKGQLLLKGGMLFRLMGSPRATADLDYVWIRTQKRNLFAQEIKQALDKLGGIKIENISSNSKGVFLDGLDESTKNKFKIEINVVEKINLPPETRNTALLADKYALEGRVIATMALAENFSHKIAAAIERSLARDFFDILEAEAITDFDAQTLLERFSKIVIDRQQKKKISPAEGARLLQGRMESLSEDQIKQELSAWLNPDRLVGLRDAMRLAVNRLCRRIQELKDT